MSSPGRDVDGERSSAGNGPLKMTAAQLLRVRRDLDHPARPGLGGRFLDDALLHRFGGEPAGAPERAPGGHCRRGPRRNRAGPASRHRRPDHVGAPALRGSVQPALVARRHPGAGRERDEEQRRLRDHCDPSAFHRVPAVGIRPRSLLSVTGREANGATPDQSRARGRWVSGWPAASPNQVFMRLRSRSVDNSRWRRPSSVVPRGPA